MKPSSEQGVVAVLDTVPECKVILDALEDNNFPKDPIGPSPEDFEGGIGVRFRRQTQFEPRPPHASAYVELVWKIYPEFKIEEEDVDFAKRAALRILNQRKLSERIFNQVTNRTKAAKTILDTLIAVKK